MDAAIGLLDAFPLTLDEVESAVPDWVPSVVVDVGAALLVLLLGWWFGKLAVRFSGRYVARRFQRPSITRMVLRGMRAGIFAFALVIASGILNVGGTEILLSVTVIAAVAGIVLAPLVANFINGFFVLADQPYEIGDLIEITDAGHTGFVEDITIRYTKIFTLDNTLLVIPNATIRERDVVNYSGEDERTRQSLQFVVTYEGDLAQARRIVERAAREVDNVITGGPSIRIGGSRYPAGPRCFIDAFGDDGVVLTLRYWVKQPYRLLSTRSQVQERVWAQLEDADVEIAYPHRQLVFDERAPALAETNEGAASGISASEPAGSEE